MPPVLRYRRYRDRENFSFHHGIADHEVFGRLSLAAFGLWAKAGSWTSAHHSLAFVPHHALDEISDGTDINADVNELINTGVWTRVAGGYHMEYGPNNDIPRPVWRYDDSDVIPRN